MKEIIEANRSRIKAIIRKLTGSDNEDIEQEVYIKTWRNLDKYQEEGKFNQWIGLLTANICRDYFKSKQFKQTVLQVNNEEVLQNLRVRGRQEEIIDAKARQKIILKAVDSLPTKLRQVVVWYEFEELSYEQIAKKTGVPVGTVKSRLFHARRILSEKLVLLKENINE